ncbi:MAG: trigger factor [Treponema sp. CETP13]|nr:MAG: trigger factor [Treponema sp. CETP13]
MKVTKELKSLEKSAVSLTVTISKDEVGNAYSETLAKYSKTLQIPGFRKGKAPQSIIESKFGDSLKGECAGTLVEKALGIAFDEIEKEDPANRPLPYAQPTMDTAPTLDTTKDFSFTVKYDILPKVKIEKFNDIEIKEPQVTIGKAELDKELTDIQERNATVLDCKDDEAAAKGNIVTVDFVEIAKDGKEVDRTKREDFTFTIGTNENFYKIDSDVIGMKKGETKEITKKYSDKEEEETLKGTTKNIKVTVKAVKIKNIPALDDELAQDVNDKYKTLEDMKADIKKNLKTAADKKIREIKSKELINKLIEKYPFEVPDSLVAAENESRWRMMAQQFQTTPEQLEKMLVSTGQTKEDMIKQMAGDTGNLLKSRIIVESLLQERTYEIDEKEITTRIEQVAQEAGAPLDEVKKYYDSADQKQYLIEDMKEQKLYDELFAEVKITKGDKIKFADLFKQQ